MSKPSFTLWVLNVLMTPLHSRRILEASTCLSLLTSLTGRLQAGKGGGRGRQAAAASSSCAAAAGATAAAGGAADMTGTNLDLISVMSRSWGCMVVRCVTRATWYVEG